MRLIEAARQSSIGLLTFFISVAFLWPLRTISPIADDLHLISQGSGIMRVNGLWHVIDLWSDFSLSSAHFTPLGGVWTGIYVWITNQLAMRTPLTLLTAWGILRVFSIAFAIQAVLHLGRTIAQRYDLPRSFKFILLLVLLSTIQVHAYWSNDPVVSFPIASWAFCIIGFYFLSFLLRSLNQDFWPQKRHTYITVALAVVGILTYELFLAFLVAGFFVTIWKVLPLRRLKKRSVFLLVTAVIAPAMLLVISQLLRLSGGSSYTGTEISLQDNSIPKIFLMAALSSLPLANLNLTYQLLPDGQVNGFQFLISVLVLFGLTLFVLLKTKKPVKAPRTALLPVVLALSALWITATALIVITPKYQDELGGVLGKVYVNYAPSWLAISLLISIGLTILLSRRAQRVSLFVLLLLPLLGSWQVWGNLRQTSILTIDSSWSRPLFKMLETPIDQNPKRCAEFDVLFGMPLPEYYQNEIYVGMQDTYRGSNGVPYCDFDSLDNRSPVTVRNVAGLYRVEFDGTGNAFFWSNANLVTANIVYRGEKPFTGLLEIQLDPTPCKSRHNLKIKIDKFSPVTTSISDLPIQVQKSVELLPGDVIPVQIEQTGQTCSIDTDPRIFMPMLRMPNLITDENS